MCWFSQKTIIEKQKSENKNRQAIFFLQNDLYIERKSLKQNTSNNETKYIQQCPNWYFATEKGNVKCIANKITKQNN